MRDIGPPALVPLPFTVFTSMFLHGGLMHLVGQHVVPLAVRGQRRGPLGRVRFLIFYLLTGTIGALAQCALMPALAGPHDRGIRARWPACWAATS